jgi:hypothetical protein
VTVADHTLPSPQPLEKSPPDYVQINVRGEDPGTWKRLRGSLVSTIQQMLGSLADVAESGKVREEARKISVAALEYARAKLEKPGLENAKIEAEVLRHYAEREKALAEARVKNAEAEKVELANAVRKLKLSLGAAKVMLIGEDGDEAALFSLQIDEFLRVLKELDEFAESTAGEAEKKS